MSDSSPIQDDVGNPSEAPVQQAEALAANPHLLQAVLDTVVDGIITFEPSGRILSVNPAAARIFGYPAKELVGQHMERLIPQAFPLTEGGHYSADLMAYVNDMGHEIPGWRSNESMFPMYCAISHMTFQDQQFYSAVIQDISERKRLETEELENERLTMQLEKERELRDMKNRFLSMMSHDLRTPLAAIRLGASMIKNYGAKMSDQEKHEYLEAIEGQTNYLSDLMGDMLILARNEFTGDQFNPELLDLETYLRDIIEETQIAQGMRCCINFSGTGRRVEARIDRKLMRRAATNLLTNAIKYAPEGSPIDIDLAVTGKEALIHIRDQGIGIPEADLPRLFEPFHRASNVGKIQGTGLGLAITRQMIEVHGGRITVESQVGTGTTFIVRLPVI